MRWLRHALIPSRVNLQESPLGQRDQARDCVMDVVPRLVTQRRRTQSRLAEVFLCHLRASVFQNQAASLVAADHQKAIVGGWWTDVGFVV